MAKKYPIMHNNNRIRDQSLKYFKNQPRLSGISGAYLEAGWLVAF